MKKKENLFNQYKNLFLNNKKKLINTLPLEHLPAKFVKYILSEWADLEAGNISNDQLNKIIDNLTNFAIELKEKMPFDIAFTTNGGINVNEIVPKTLAAKKEPNLYFIGECLDVTAYTGGYNISLWFSMGYTCGSQI